VYLRIFVTFCRDLFALKVILHFSILFGQLYQERSKSFFATWL